MAKQSPPGGSIIAISSISALVGGGTQTHYTPTKLVVLDELLLLRRRTLKAYSPLLNRPGRESKVSPRRCAYSLPSLFTFSFSSVAQVLWSRAPSLLDLMEFVATLSFPVCQSSFVASPFPFFWILRSLTSLPSTFSRQEPLPPPSTSTTSLIPSRRRPCLLGLVSVDSVFVSSRESCLLLSLQLFCSFADDLSLVFDLYSFLSRRHRWSRHLLRIGSFARTCIRSSFLKLVEPADLSSFFLPLFPLYLKDLSRYCTGSSLLVDGGLFVNLQ